MHCFCLSSEQTAEGGPYKPLPKLKLPDSDDNCSLSATDHSSSYASADNPPPSEFLREAIFAAGKRRLRPLPLHPSSFVGLFKSYLAKLGSFWRLEASFGRIHGVILTSVGYFGGFLRNPNHGEVSERRTGHTEAVKVVYDSQMISFSALCRVFWESHDPTDKDYLKFGVDTHYASIIFYRSEEERKWAQESKVRWQLKLNRRIVTKILPSGSSEFYLAESQHQKYYLQRKNSTLCVPLGLRSSKQFAESHIACKINALLADDVKETDERKLRSLMERYQLPPSTKMALENVIQELKDRREKWVTFDH